MASGTSYNGWPANSDKDAIGVVPSDWFPGGVKAGDVTTVLRYVVEQFDQRVEKIVGGWCWGYTYKQNVNNPSSLSCHASGTALDINAPEHPNGAGGTFTNAQVGEIYAILDEVQGACDWLEGYDEMHFEIDVDAETLARIAATLPTGPRPKPPPLPEVGNPMSATFVMLDGAGAGVVIGQVLYGFDSPQAYENARATSPDVPAVHLPEKPDIRGFWDRLVQASRVAEGHT